MLQQIAAFAVTIAMTLSPGVGAMPAKDDAQMTGFMNSINQAHSLIDAPMADLSAYHYDYSSGKPMFTAKDGPPLLQAWDGTRPADNATLSSKDAKAEVEWIFRLLRTQYGLYQWFGGDEAFEAAQTKILEALPKNGEAKVRISDYEKLLTSNLSFINDTHFMINRTNLQHALGVYTDESRPFYEDSGKFYGDKECTSQVLSVNGQAPENMIHRAIGQDGELTWYLYTTAPKAEYYTATVRYIGKTETVKLHPALSFQNQEPEYERFGYAVKNGIPYVQINEMFFGDDDSSGWADQHDEELMQQVLATASEFKKYPAAVIDLSHNPGGNGELPLEWFRHYTGQEPQPNFCTLRVRSSNGWLQAGYGAQNEEDIAVVREELDTIYGKDSITSDGAYYMEAPTKQFVDNDGATIFVLTSRNTASAAEGFTDILHNLENVVTIGSNTGGVLTNGANYGLKLPYSQLPFQFGECLFLWDKAYFEEGKGMTPDLYLTGNNLDRRLQQFLERYGDM